jgi:hypothetical protein
MVFCAGTLVAATCSSASASSSPGPASPAYTYARHYVKGQVVRYTYTENESGAVLTAVARLRSYVHHGIGGEQVKWVALDSGGQNLDAQARAFPPYNLSLDPRDQDGLALPNTQTAGLLQGPIEDLGTFYVSLSGRVGIDNLHQPGQSYVDPTLLSGNFSNATTPVGQDLIQLTTTLTGLSARRATFTSSYQPPSGGGLTLTQPWMDSPVCGSVPNNFEQVQAKGADWDAVWGCEQFTITTVVDRASGQIVSVQMTNPLQLDATQCLDEALTECSPITPFTLPRTVQLTRN